MLWSFILLEKGRGNIEESREVVTVKLGNHILLFVVVVVLFLFFFFFERGVVKRSELGQIHLGYLFMATHGELCTQRVSI